ncbi:MAG: transketolase C-terminal domain-containing protein [archaeon]
MKKAMMSVLMKIAEKEDLVILSGDLGFNLFEEFAEKYPDRFFNMGIAEQNMIGVAAGLAKTGKKVFVYSIIPFVTFRVLEQIRNDLCYPSLNVVVAGVGTGYSYGSLGFSHHAIEDVAALRGIPNLTILSPADVGELKSLLKESFSLSGPAYIRLGKSEQEMTRNNLKIGDLNIIKNGKDVIILSHGDILEEVLKADKLLKEKGVNATIVSVPTLKPVGDKLKRLCSMYKKIVVVEEVNRIGGLGDIVYSLNLGIPITHIAVDDRFTSVAGDQVYLRKLNGLDAGSIVSQITR